MRTLRHYTQLLLSAVFCLTATASAQFSGPPTVANATLPAEPTAPLTTDQQILFPTQHDYVLATGDLLHITLFGQTEYQPTVRIGQDGDVELPLIGIIHLAGLTPIAAQDAIAHRLVSMGFYRDPQVSIQVAETPNGVITVIGEAHAVVPAVGQRRLLDVLAAANGLPPTASHRITIRRPGQEAPIVVDLGPDPATSLISNLPLFAGDVVIVSRIGNVYMVGAFKTNGALPLSNYAPLTLSQATALSGGLLFEGKYDDVHIIRTVGNQRTVSTVDIKAVLRGRKPDPILQPNDIIFMPSSVLKGSLANGTVGTLLSVANLLAIFALR